MSCAHQSEPCLNCIINYPSNTASRVGILGNRYILAFKLENVVVTI